MERIESLQISDEKCIFGWGVEDVVVRLPEWMKNRAPTLKE